MEEGAEVEKHRQFIQSAFPQRQQRASVVSDHLQNDIPGLQAVLERMGFVVAAAMTAANEQQTTILETIMDGNTNKILKGIADLATSVADLQGKHDLAPCFGGTDGNAFATPTSPAVQSAAWSPTGIRLSSAQHNMTKEDRWKDFFTQEGNEGLEASSWQHNPQSYCGLGDVFTDYDYRTDIPMTEVDIDDFYDIDDVSNQLTGPPFSTSVMSSFGERDNLPNDLTTPNYLSNEPTALAHATPHATPTMAMPSTTVSGVRIRNPGWVLASATSTARRAINDKENLASDNGGRQHLPAAVIPQKASLRTKPITLAELDTNYHWDNRFNAGAHSVLQRLAASTAARATTSKTPSSSKQAEMPSSSSRRAPKCLASTEMPSSSTQTSAAAGPTSSKTTSSSKQASAAARPTSSKTPSTSKQASAASPTSSKDTSAFIVDQLFAFIDIEWNDGAEIVQYAYIVIRGDGTVVGKVKLLSVRSRNVDMPLRVTKLTVQQLEAGKPLRECRDEMEVAFCQSGTTVGWSFAHDVTVINNDLRTEGLLPLLDKGVCALAFARKIFKHTKRTTQNFTQKEVGIALGITDAMLEDHFADDDAVLGSRIFAELLRIAKDELRVITEDELTNLMDHDALPGRQDSSRNAGKKRSAS